MTMKALKITFLLLAVLVLTVSGQSSDTIKQNEVDTYEATTTYDLIALNKSKKTLQPQG
ncbi:hypothetical protein BXY80_0563 [Ichthyenterobacterium magnum]|uniref:Uncharacterized protein n=2 Tax=Ichthyenterobacterium magnum TaxID=1230530 RepID=A0A420DW86_9FLAO|nr:hypothetical protein BXY80_0563 [Ichthyenterobacterium magnum]